MKKTKLKLRLCSFFIAFACIFQVFCLPITYTYADDDYSWLPDGYKIYKSEILEDGKIKYYLIPVNEGFHEYDEEGKSFSFSPQMTYALYGVEGDSIIDDANDIMETIADYYDVGIDELTHSLVYDYMRSMWDKSSALSNSFAYSGIPDEDSYCMTTFDNIDLNSWFSYVDYWVHDLAGLNDWYIALSNMFGWHNVYDSDIFSNYKNDYVTFALYNDDDYDLFHIGTNHGPSTQIAQGRWHEGNIVVSGYNVVKFQSIATSILSSGTLIMDNVKVSTGLKTKLSDLFTSLCDGAWLDILEYNDYKKIHTGEMNPINMNWLESPAKDITIEGNNFIVTIPDNYSYKIGYYVDYLTFNGKTYHLFRHYFYPEAVGDKLIINGNSLETKLPFTNCSLDGTIDNTLIKGIGLFGYGLDKNSTKTVAEFAPTRTVGMGDISFTTAYNYYCFDYPFKDNQVENYGYDFNIDIDEYECLVYTVENNEKVLEATETIDYKHEYRNIVVSDAGTYIENNITYNIDGDYIEQQINNLSPTISDEDKKDISKDSLKCCTNCTCTKEKHCENCKEVDGVLKCTCFTLKNNCKCYTSSSASSDDKTDDEYWAQWKNWVESCKQFIAGVPELFGYVFSWLPEPLVLFITTSIATGFGIAVIKVILRRE